MPQSRCRGSWRNEGTNAPNCPRWVFLDLQIPTDQEYLASLHNRGFDVEVLAPFLGYFELVQRGIGFLTKTEPWCIPMLIGTGFLEWLQTRGARSPRAALMFRGISGSEWSRRYHAGLELYAHLDLPCVNPLLGLSKQDMLEVVSKRYGLPLNPVCAHLSRTYCICCYAPDSRRQAYSFKRFPVVCAQFYGHIEQCLFESGLVNSDRVPAEYRTKEHQLMKHGFMHWRRLPRQDSAGAVKRRLKGGGFVYAVRNRENVDQKHMLPVAGNHAIIGNEIRFWNVPERVADSLPKRIMTCLDCGFCAVQCLPCRRFDQKTKRLQIEGCTQCGSCLNLKYCMGWRQRFWRRTIVEAA